LRERERERGEQKRKISKKDEKAATTRKGRNKKSQRTVLARDLELAPRHQLPPRHHTERARRPGRAGRVQCDRGASRESHDLFGGVLVLLDGVAEAAVAAVAPGVGTALVVERCLCLLN